MQHHLPTVAMLCLALLGQGGAGNLLVNGTVESSQGGNPRAWMPTTLPGAEFAHAQDAERPGNHVLTIVKTDPKNRAAHNWLQRVELGKKHPERLQLAARVRG